MPHNSNSNNTGQNGAEIDESLYSRQLYVLGHEAMQRMAQSNVLIVGLSGLGVEIAKNVILTGVKSVTLHDEKTVAWEDLSAQFYVNESHIGQNRVDACIAKLQELNPYVPVQKLEGSLSEDVISQFKVIVFADHHTIQLTDVGDMARKHGVSFIVAESRGLFGSIFVDNGHEFEIFDKDGEQTVTNIVTNITNDENGVVSVHDERTTHGLSDGDWVVIEDVKGMDEINGREFQIKSTGRHTFTIGADTSQMGKYISGGYAKQIKKPIKESYLPLREAIAQPEFVLTDFAKMDRPPHLHAAFRALGEFATQNGGKLPRSYNAEDASQVLALAKQHMSDVDETVVTRLANTARGNLNPMAAFIGGVASQEVQKACSGKFTPIKQWLYIDVMEALPDKLPTEDECAPQKSRYDGQIAVFGKTFQEKLLNQRNFIVGAGALGCEYLKNFAMMGVGCGPNGKVYVTDMDSIEISNLNRQFLFRKQHVGQMKSTVAAEAAKEMNPDMKVEALSDKVAPETEHVFDDEFWDSLTGVTNALDNVEARLYVDSRCIYYKKPLLEAGTLGAKGNTQVVIPNLTESYGSQPDPQERSIAICTLKHFPNAIEHCIQWARDEFEGQFNATPQEVNAYVSRADYLQELDRQPTNKKAAIESIYESLVTAKPSSFDDCVVWARFKYEELFNNNIKQLLYNFPLDMKTSSGAPFWGGPKRPPTPLEFDPKDEMDMTFIIAASNLRAQVYGIKGHREGEYDFHKTLSNIAVPEFKPKSNVKISADDREEANRMREESSSNIEEDAELRELIDKLPNPSELSDFRANVIEFEKDDDTNFHMDFVTAASNLRARNYKIEEADRHKTKGIAGRIIPAMVTTTALVTGLASFELYKMVLGKKKLEDYRNAFVNIAIPFFTLSEPMPPPKIYMREGKDDYYTLWDRLEVDVGRDVTLKEFMDIFKEKFKYEISMISTGQSMIYTPFGNRKKTEERMKKPVSEVVKEISKREFLPKQKYLVLTVLCNDEEGEDVDVPEVRYRFRF